MHLTLQLQMEPLYTCANILYRSCEHVKLRQGHFDPVNVLIFALNCDRVQPLRTASLRNVC